MPHHPGNPLARWLEHDPWDKLPPAPRVVVLCRRCSDEKIDAHPRLYRRLDAGAPFPGCMSVCVRCKHRSGVRCDSTAAKTNGGPGLEFQWDKPPATAHLNYGGGRGDFKVFYSGPVASCSGHS